MEEVKNNATREKKNISILVESRPKVETDKAMTKSDNDKKFFVRIGILLTVVIVAVVIAIIVVVNQNRNADESGIENYTMADDSAEKKTLENTELKSGSVIATIGGKSVTYKAAYVVDGIEATIGSGAYESVSDNEAVFLVINGGKLTIDGEVAINKSGSENFQGRGDEYSFYGTNSAIVVVGEESSLAINGATINTDVSGANAVVATNGSVVKISESTINTSKDNSRGLHATFGGTINADNVKISTQGQSCAALATDRGEGTVVADNMMLSTAGAGSPLIYSTGKITVTNSSGMATGAQIAVVEGKNSVNLQGCEFATNGNGNRGSVDNAGVMIYQSMSGDASTGTGSFTATDCRLSVSSSSDVYMVTPFFFVTNTEATIDLTGTSVEFSENEYFISALGTNEWGRSGSNGGRVTVSVSNINATNTNVDVDNISNVTGL